MITVESKATIFVFLLVTVMQNISDVKLDSSYTHTTNLFRPNIIKKVIDNPKEFGMKSIHIFFMKYGIGKNNIYKHV